MHHKKVDVKEGFKENGKLDPWGSGNGIISRIKLIQNKEVIELGKKETDIRKEIKLACCMYPKSLTLSLGVGSCSQLEMNAVHGWMSLAHGEVKHHFQ